MSEERDLEKGDLEKELEALEVHVSDYSSCDPEHSKERDSSVVAAQAEEKEILSDDPPRGRRDSKGSQSSHDSQKTLSDGGLDLQTGTRSRSQSRARSSIRSVRRDPVKVPRRQRRGLFGRFTIIAEVTNQYDYPRKTKWFLTFVVAVAGACAPMASSIVLPALVDIAHDFNTTSTIVNLSISLYMLSMSIFPLWWSSFSESLGRRTIYLTSFTLYIIFSILGAVSTNIGMFLATRMLSGGAAASVQAVGGGSIADIWEVRERGRAMGIFYLGPLCGPLLAPIIGGLLAEYLGWRSCQWFLTILGVIVLMFLFFFLPETLRERKSVVAQAEAEVVVEAATDEKGEAIRPTISRTTTQSVVQIKTKKYLTVLRRWFVDPLRITVYLQFPAVAICVFYATVTFCALYSLNLSIQQTFSAKPYNYSNVIVGLTYLPNSVGYFVTSIWGGKWVDRIMAREATARQKRNNETGRLKYRPEDRMKENAWVGAAMYPAALIAYGWCAEYGVNLAAPLVANFFFGVGSMLIFAMVTTMLTEFMPRKGSHGIALNNFVRNIFSCVGSAITEPLIVAIGNGWLFTGFAVIALVSGAFSMWAMRKYGDHWRITMDKKIEKAMGD